MKNYNMINEAVTVAEDLLRTTKQNYENCICNTEWSVKEQISNYIYEQLKIAKFPNNIYIRIENPGRSIECYDVYFQSGDYGVKGQHFKYQLFIRTHNGKVSRIFFDEYEYYESEEQPIREETLLALIQAWSELKTQLIPSIDKSYQQRIDQIKKQSEEIKKRQTILTSFKL